MGFVFHLHEEIAFWMSGRNGKPFTRVQLLEALPYATKALDYFIREGHVVVKGDQLRYVHEMPPRRPCVRCGFCCKQAPCHLGRGVPCMFLVRDGERRYRCKLVTEATGAERSRLERELAIGQGCCSPLCNSDREAILQSG